MGISCFRQFLVEVSCIWLQRHNSTISSIISILFYFIFSIRYSLALIDVIKLYLYAAINTNTDLDGMILWALLHANVEPATFGSRCHTNTQNGDINSPLFCGCFIITHWILNKIAINLHFLENKHACALTTCIIPLVHWLQFFPDILQWTRTKCEFSILMIYIDKV